MKELQPQTQERQRYLADLFQYLTDSQGIDAQIKGWQRLLKKYVNSSILEEQNQVQGMNAKMRHWTAIRNHSRILNSDKIKNLRKELDDLTKMFS